MAPQFRPGQRVTLVTAPDELLHNLLDSDQAAINALVGMAGIFVAIDRYGFTEIEFNEEPTWSRTIWVRPEFVAPTSG